MAARDSVLFCTPCYGGQVTRGFWLSTIALEQHMMLAHLPHAWQTLENESLITRGRNVLSAHFLASEFDKLFFIDADILFTPDDVGKILSLDADVGVGVYPMKARGAGYNAWIKGKLAKDILPFERPVEVDYAGTGFMCIRRSVFGRLKSAYPKLRRQEGLMHDRKPGECWNFFGQMPIDVPGELSIEVSEDYAFCERFRRIGGKIVMDPSVRLKHIGTAVYDGT